MSPRFAECHASETDSEHVLTSPASARSSPCHTVSRLNGKFLRLCAVAIVFATMFTPTNAYFDQGICCMLAVRANITYYDDNPWTVCDTDHAYVYLNPGPYASVNVTMGWCQQNCGGHEPSSSDEWIRPLATWILPAVALLLICSVGEREKEDSGEKEDSDEKGDRNDKTAKSWWKKTLGFRYKAQEYVALIGDPASAICGGFSEIVTDARILLLKPRNWFEKAMVGVSTLAGSTKFNEEAVHINKLWTNAENNRSNVALLDTTTSTAANAIDDPSRSDEDENSISATQDQPPVESDRDIKKVKTQLFYGIRVLLKARLNFINAIFLPVVMLFATTAASFHDAYDSNGDVETAHNLSYGVWYSWIIILAVVSNSIAASMNPGIAEAAIRDLVDLSSPTLPLRKRFPNSIAWGDWAKRLCGGSEDFSSSKLFYSTYIIGQLSGWACVTVACASATVISYNTPTTGIGCDTFTYILYGVLSLVVALLLVLRHWVRVQMNGRQHVTKPSHKHSGWKIADDVLKAIYALLVFSNAMVLFGSTLFHLVGLYRSCRCQALFGSSTALLELNFFTQQAIDNATEFWLPVGYMCFSFVWVVCMTAIMLRAFLYFHFHKPSSPFADDGQTRYQSVNQSEDPWA
jgi:hypothetical protein